MDIDPPDVLLNISSCFSCSSPLTLPDDATQDYDENLDFGLINDAFPELRTSPLLLDNHDDDILQHSPQAPLQQWTPPGTPLAQNDDLMDADDTAQGSLQEDSQRTLGSETRAQKAARR